MNRLLILFVLMAIAIGSHAQCNINSNFTITLKTTGGVTVTKVSPNTTYKVHVQQAPATQAPFYNSCYNLFNNIRCTPASGTDTMQETGLAIFTITTSATQVGSGISFAISPIFANCSCQPNPDWAESRNYSWN